MAPVSKTGGGSAEGVTREGRDGRSGLGALFLLLLLPPLTFWLFNLRMVHQAFGLDPFVYTGYINNSEDLLRRFGILYYSVRFGLILPGRLFTWMLGSESWLSCAALYAGIGGWSALVPVCQADFQSSAGDSGLRGADCLSVVRSHVAVGPTRTQPGCHFCWRPCAFCYWECTPAWVRDGLAGACASMAVNSNAFTVAMLGIFGAVYVAASLVYGTGWRTLMLRGIRFATGFLLVLAAGATATTGGPWESRLISSSQRSPS